MPINRLAVLIAVIAVFAFGVTRLASVPSTAAGESLKRTAGSCAVDRQAAAGSCVCHGQKTSQPAPCATEAAAPTALRRRIGTVDLGRERHSDNCVYFVRDRVRSLPYGLGTWKGKLAIVNARAPRRGDVAIIEVAGGPYQDVGHVAIIEQVTADTITIVEANYYAGRVSRRIATGANAREAAALLGIAGYFRP